MSMSGLLRVFDPDSADEETRRLSRLAQGCWSPLAIVYDPLKSGSIDSTDTVPHDKAIIRAQNAEFAPNKRIKGRPECTVFVGNLNAATKERSLREEFSRYGRIVKASVVEDIITGRSRGYGFVEFSLEGEAAKAYEYAHRSWLDGNKLVVDMECGRVLPGWVPRRLGGGFNGRKESGQLRFGCRERPFRKPIKLLTEKEIKKVFEKTMGRKLSSQAKHDAEPTTAAQAGGSSQILEAASEKRLESSGDRQSDVLVEDDTEPERDGRSSNIVQDKEIGKRGRDRGRHSSDRESSKRDKLSKERETKTHRDNESRRHHKKKKRRRSRSQSYSLEEEQKHRHHKRRKERS